MKSKPKNSKESDSALEATIKRVAEMRRPAFVAPAVWSGAPFILAAVLLLAAGDLWNHARWVYVILWVAAAIRCYR